MQVIHKDLLTVDRGVLFHQVNCMGVMGGGIARSIALKWPQVEAAYKGKCDRTSNPERLLGRTFMYGLKDDLFIANVFGQNSISRTSRQTNYEATVEAFERLQESQVIKNLPLYFPKNMGCGLGGGNWKIYSAIIEAHFPDAIICEFP